MRFDLDKPPAQGDDLRFLSSAEWWRGLIEAVRKGARLVVDPATGLQVVPGTDNNTIALAGSRRKCWARASTPIGPPSGTNGVQMTGGTVRLWFVDAAGLRTDSGINVVAYNGWPGETVPSNSWMVVELLDVWTIQAWACA